MQIFGHNARAVNKIVPDSMIVTRLGNRADHDIRRQSESGRFGRFVTRAIYSIRIAIDPT